MAANVVSRLFNRTVAITRPVRTSTGPGSSSVTYEAVATVRGALRVSSQREETSEARVESIYDHVLYLPIGTDVQRAYRFTIVGESPVYRVVEVEDAAYRGHHLEVKARREID